VQQKSEGARGIASGLPVREQIPILRHRAPHVECFDVFEDELGTIERGYSSRQTDLTFLSISLSVCVSFVVSFLASKDPEPSWEWGLVFATGFASIYFLVRWRTTVKREESIFARIRGRSTGPVGDDAVGELKPSSLGSLPVEEPPVVKNE
jgi:hypothetical protein